MVFQNAPPGTIAIPAQRTDASLPIAETPGPPAHPSERTCFHSEAGAPEQDPSSRPRLEMQVGAVEQATLMLRETAHQHVPAKIKWPLLGSDPTNVPPGASRARHSLSSSTGARRCSSTSAQMM